MTGARPGDDPWRVGQHYGIHVYAGERPVATFHDPADAQRAVDAVNGAERPSDELRERYPCYCLPGEGRCDDPYNWCDRAARELRDALAVALQPVAQVEMRPADLADALLPVVTAYAERRAEERAAEELRAAARQVEATHAALNVLGVGVSRLNDLLDVENELNARAEALTADDRAGQQ